MRLYLQGAGLAALALAISQPAFAADAATSAPAPAATTETASSGAAGLAEIIVTATKRETSLQETPIAIDVVGADAIEDRHVESLFNLADGSVPALRVATFEARQSALTIGIRGIVPFDQNQTARDMGVGVYIDGVYLGRTQGLNAALFDVQRIEVARGPQGTLFGRNAEGGAVSIVTKAPTGEFGGRMSAGFGNYGSYSGEIHQDLPAFGNLAIKLDGVVQHQDATTKNPLEGQAGWNQYHRVGGRLQGLWKPTSTFSADFSIDYADDENTPFFSQLVSYNPYGKRVRTLAEITAVAAAPAGTINPLAPLMKVRTDRQKVADIGAIQQVSEDKTGGATLALKWKATDNLELRSITAYRSVATNQWDNSGIESRSVFAPNSNFGRYSLSDLYQNQFSQEFQAVGDFGPTIEYAAGLYYFKENVKESAATPFTNVWNADGTNYTLRSQTGTFGTGAITSANQGWQHGTRFMQRASRANAESYAVFGQGTWTPVAPLHLTLGGRWTKDKRDGVLYTVAGKATNFPFTFDDSRFDPMATVAYDLTSDVHAYAKYATGYRAGGANSRSQTFQAFGPEEVKSYELGLKSTFLDRRLVVNIAAYHMDRDNTQIDFDNVDTTPGSPTLGAHTEETRNAKGTSKINGIELDTSFRLSENWSVGGSYAWTDVKVPAAPFPFTGNPDVPLGTPFPVNVVYTPKHAASAYIDFEAPTVGGMTFRAHLDAAYASPQYSFQTEFADVSPTGKLVQHVAAKGDRSFIVNGRIALADINLKNNGPSGTIALWARNLLNDDSIYRISVANRGTIGDYANFNPPRTFGIEASIRY
jgi:iron complex outermembrane receptor protein